MLEALDVRADLWKYQIERQTYRLYSDHIVKAYRWGGGDDFIHGELVKD